MVASIGTSRPASADHAWRLLKWRDALLQVTRGALDFSGSERWPEEFREDQEIRTRLSFFHAIPAWERHLVGLVRVDDARRELLSREHGGFVRSWEHRIGIEPEGLHRCRYTDEISVETGIFTAAAALSRTCSTATARGGGGVSSATSPCRTRRAAGDRPCRFGAPGDIRPPPEPGTRVN